jgi:hypothetical protein
LVLRTCGFGSGSLHAADGLDVQPADRLELGDPLTQVLSLSAGGGWSGSSLQM